MKTRNLLLNPDPPAEASSGASTDTSSASAGAGATSAGKAKKKQKDGGQIKLEIEHSRLQDENQQLKQRLTEMEKWAEGLGRSPKPGKGKKDAGEPAASAGDSAGLDWESWINGGCGL